MKVKSQEQNLKTNAQSPKKTINYFQVFSNALCLCCLISLTRMFTKFNFITLSQPNIIKLFYLQSVRLKLCHKQQKYLFFTCTVNKCYMLQINIPSLLLLGWVLNLSSLNIAKYFIRIKHQPTKQKKIHFFKFTFQHLHFPIRQRNLHNK